jgi:glucose/arabinose dehydrogenase
MNPHPLVSNVLGRLRHCRSQVFLGIVGLLCATTARAVTLPSGFAQTQIATNLAGPTRVEVSPDNRIFVLEKPGRVRVIKNGTMLSTPYLTVTVDTQGERGLLGIAFDPNFATNRFVYVYYTATTPAIHNRISRFTANSTNPDVVDSSSETILFELPNLNAIYHNGGAIHFGTDGKLYAAVGDNKTNSPAQSLSSLWGKILRINSDGSIPTDNPFYTATTGVYRAIWAYGLRNPWSFAVQPGTGEILINDVGESTWEEVNLGAAGANYGWPNTEGPTSDPQYVTPLYYYSTHGVSGSCAICGATFYNPTAGNQQFPSSYVGKYFFGDLCGGWIRVLDPQTATVNGFFLTGGTNLVDVKMAPDGSLYYLQQGTGSNTGALYQIRYTSAPSISQQPQNLTVNVGQTATFSVTVSGTTPFTYQWRRNGTSITGATSSSYSFVAQASDNGAQFTVVVTNSVGTATSNVATLTVNSTGTTPPTASITQPLAGATFSGGDTIFFAGTASDSKDGTLPASAYNWSVTFQHDTHFHPFIDSIPGVTSGSFTIPYQNVETSPNVWYRIHLVATNSSNVSTEVIRDVLPLLSNVTLATSPSGLRLTLDGIPVTAPYTFTGVQGITRTLGTTTPQTLGNQPYNFAGWSDGGTMTHDIRTPTSDTTYTATFTAATTGTPVSMEAESLPVTTNGPTTTVTSDSTASGGAWIALNATAIGNYMQFTSPSLPAGSYMVQLAYKTNTNRGTGILAVDGAQVGDPLDQYSATVSYPTVTFGAVTFATAGTHTLRLAVTDKNASSTAYNLIADRFIFTPINTSTQVGTPMFTPGGGNYSSAISVAIATGTSGATIRYTTDGSLPSSTVGTVYTGPIPVSSTTTIKAIAYASGMSDSPVSSATYNILASYTISASAGANGSISPSGSVSVTQGANQIFAITPNSGNVVADVTVDGTSVGAVTSYTFSNVQSNHTISATFAPVPTFTITASAGANGSISPSGAVTVNQGASQAFTIAPSAGYTVSSVTVDGTSVGAVTSYTFTNVQANHTISAAFVVNSSTTITAAMGFYNQPIAAQTGQFTVQFDASPSLSPTNATLSLSQGTVTAYSGMATIVRFNTSGDIDARNAGAYTAAATIPYSANTVYHFRMAIDVSAHTYSIFVTPPGGSEITVGANYAFRTEQAGVTQLDNWNADVAATPGGSVTVSNFTITGALPQVAAPTFSPAGGSYTSAQSVAIGTTTAGASIRYTTDGSTPTSTTGTLYSGPVTVNATTTLKAIAYESGMADSAVRSATYTITVPQVVAPTFSPGGGSYSSAQTVTISSTTSGASIRYTTDGSTPTSTTGTLYSGPVTISVTTTLKAIAFASGMTDSTVTSATYTIGVTDTNIAPSGTGYGWKANTSATANTNKTAQAGLNDNNLTADVDINSAGDAVNAWEGAGVTWTTAKSISSAKFINGTVTTGGDGFLTANCKLQFSTDGATWVDSGWTISPAYPNSASASGQTYTFSGTAVSGKLGARVVGQVRTVDTSYHWIVKEVQVIGH